MLFSTEKVMDEMELRNNHDMMTLKRFRVRKKISETGTDRLVENVGLAARKYGT